MKLPNMARKLEPPTSGSFFITTPMGAARLVTNAIIA